ncbi:sialic acid-binding Ig-like lectin 5 isoform X2 [Kryptolebias marmoratus]|nr:sialic acid-binding Ig-like lectin 5 isoform X2 [Kryptolebias marmoratus]
MDKNGYIFHPQESQILQEYRTRTKLLGDAANKNCSLLIDSLRPNDTGPFWFRIEIKDYDSFSYLNTKVSISVKREPDPIQLSVKDEMREKETVSASCSVSHSCPDSPPVFEWSHSGEALHLSQLNNGWWIATSVLTFHLTHADHGKLLQCNVTHKGGQTQSQHKTLQVKYAPMNVKVEYISDVGEGQTVGLTCSSYAHPPVSSYEWHNATGAQLYQGNLYVLPNVSRHVGELYCTAVNEVGRVTSSPVRLNVLYAPEINRESSCFSEADWVKCKCDVDSNPPSVVSFKLGDKILLGTTTDENGSYTIRGPRADFKAFEFVNCWANNTQGSANLSLHLHADDASWIIFIAAGAGGFLVLLLIAVGVFIKCRGRSGDTAALTMSTIMTEQAQENHKCATTKRNELYDDVPHSGIDADADNYYGNIGTDWDDPIYANV